MSASTHVQRIIALLAQSPALDDDEIARALSITPRQTVNQICNRLARQHVLTRERGPNGKITNRLADGLQHPDRHVPRADEQERMLTVASAAKPLSQSLSPHDLKKTLVVLPCSASKRDHAPKLEHGAGISDSLPSSLAQELRDARARVRASAFLDEASLLPALQRYDGALYAAAREALVGLLRSGAHIVILSGGYGAVLATEPIGTYEAVLKPSWWPQRLLERVLLSYAQHHALVSVRAFASSTSPYARVLRRVRWRDAGANDAFLLTPEPAPGGLTKSPACIGQAVTALRDGTLDTRWRSSHGLCIHVAAASP